MSEVIKGKWRKVLDDDGEFLWYRCSNCKRTSLNNTKFCDCGAIMNEEDSGDD